MPKVKRHPIMDGVKTINDPLLEAARRGEDQELWVCALMLQRDGLPDMIVIPTLEYGDHAGIDFIESECDAMKPYLRPGESLHVVTFQVVRLEDQKSE